MGCWIEIEIFLSLLFHLREMAEAVKVIVRKRPMNQREKDLKTKDIVAVNDKMGRIDLTDPAEPSKEPKAFTFDGAFGEKSNTRDIYARLCFPMVESVMDGFNATFFAYGQTGCGKSFTMGGLKSPEEHRGVIPRAFDHIFNSAMTDSSGTKYHVYISYLQIYNEEINDLLGDVKQKLDLKEDPKKGVVIPDITTHTVKSSEECEKLMDKGFNNRAVGATLMNADSSRSHSIFIIHVDQKRSDNKGSRSAMLNLVDLAGSERQGKTGATGDRLKEATKINLSLSALGNVISALAAGGKGKHIPYRDSKLTRLLQASLGGNTKTLMICAVSPAGDNFEETLSTLRYANRAKNIKNKPLRNEDPKDTKMREMTEEIEKLKAMIAGKTPIDKGLVKKAAGPHADASTAELEDSQSEAVAKSTAAAAAAENVLLTQNAEAAKAAAVKATEDAKKAAEEKKRVEEEYKAKLEALKAQMEKEKKEMESKFVGGEKKDDAEAKQKMKQMKDESESHAKAMLQALNKGDDKVIVETFLNLAKENQLTRDNVDNLVGELRTAKQEQEDLQMEFEQEREDLFETIRLLEREKLLLESILWKVQPLVPRNCNYYNMDAIRLNSRYAEDKVSSVLYGVIGESLL